MKKKEKVLIYYFETKFSGYRDRQLAIVRHLISGGEAFARIFYELVALEKTKGNIIKTTSSFESALSYLLEEGLENIKVALMIFNEYGILEWYEIGE